MSEKNNLISSLYQKELIQFGEFKLKSGQTSSIYLNLRKSISYPDLLRHIAKSMWEMTSSHSFDLICGVPYTALPIATCLSLEHNLPMIIRRKERKDYGTQQLIEGIYQPGQTCLLLEDIITTGSSIIETATELEHVGIKVTDVIAFIDREQGGKEILNKKYNTHTVFTLSEILNTLLQLPLLDSSERHLIEQFLQARSVQK